MLHLAADIRDLLDLLTLKGHFTEDLTATNRLWSGLSAMHDVGGHDCVIKYAFRNLVDREINGTD